MHSKSKTGSIYFCNSRVGLDESESLAQLHEGGERPSVRSPRSRCFERTRLFGIRRINSYLIARDFGLRASFRIAMVFLAALAIGLVAVPPARATGYATAVLHSFGTSGDGSLSGGFIEGALIMDSNGNLYGSTPRGGASGGGTVFELVNSSGTYTEKVLYNFTGNADGGIPVGTLLMDSAGNLYGTAQSGGPGGLFNGYGVVFELVNSSGTYSETTLHSFAYTDGYGPSGGLVRDAAGNLYGITLGGGANGSGVVFELVNSSGTYTEKLLYSFTGGADGSGPLGPLVRDTAGNLFGATSGGGANFDGTVFELVNSSGTYSETVLYSFTSTDGAGPNGGLLIDAAGNLFGTTGGNGTVFELVNSSGTYSKAVLYSFTGGADGQLPSGGLVRDAAGNLYGTTQRGGASGTGTVFELVKSSGAYTIKLLHSFFVGCAGDANNPNSPVLMDASGNLYGTTSGGGVTGQEGTVFELASFTGQAATTTTALTSSQNPATAGDGLTLTATVTPSSNLNFILSGTVTFSNASLVLGSAPMLCGTALLQFGTADTLGIGVSTITATYTPDTPAFAASSGSLNQTVNEPGVVLTNGNNTLNGNQTVNGTVNATSLVGGSLDIGGGTPITEYASITTGITLPVLVPLSCAQFTTAAVTGFTPGASDTIALGTPSSLLTGLGNGVFLVYQAWETTTTTSPTITIQVCNPSGNRYAGGASGTLRVSIFKH